MTSTIKISDTYNTIDCTSNTVLIKYGTIYYRISSNQVSYIYNAEGIFFLVDRGKLKIPMYINKISDLQLLLNTDEFFQLNENTIVHRSAVLLVNGIDEATVFARNKTYSNKFKISKTSITPFKTWLLK